MRQALRIRTGSIHPHFGSGSHAPRAANSRADAQSTALQEPVKLEDILLNIREFSQTTAMYVSQALSLGSLKDCSSLRQALRQTRKRACELAKRNKGLLLPHMRQNMFNRVEKSDVEKMWNMYAACLELLHWNLLKSLSLLRFFPMHSGLCVLIHTGLTECPSIRKKHSSPHTIDTPVADEHINQDEREIQILKSDIHEMAALLRDIEDKVDIKPWTFEPGQETSKIFDTRIQESNSEMDVESTTSWVRPSLCTCRRLKGVRLVLIVLFSVLLVASVLGVCLVLYA